MQVNDSRLFKAAKRTIRAEATLVIFIILITSWSVYALYKLTVGGTDSLLGLNINKLVSNGEPNHSSNSNVAKQHEDKLSSTNKAAMGSSSNSIATRLAQFQTHPLEATHEQPIYLPPEELKHRAHLMREYIAAKQRELYAKQMAQVALQAPAAMAALQRLRLDPETQPSKSLQADLNVARGLSDLLRRQFDRSNRHGNHHSEVDRPDDEESSGDTQADDYENRQKVDEASDGRSAPSRSEDDREPSESSVQDVELPVSRIPEDDGDSTGGSGDQTASGGDSNRHDDANSSAADDSNTSSETNRAEDNSADGSTGEDSSDPPKSDDDEEQDKGSEEERAARDAGKSIDEEVDRMTQPSSGVASRQDQPFDYRRTVQFDDSSTSAGLSTARQRRQQVAVDRQKQAGGLIPRFMDPAAKMTTRPPKRSRDEYSSKQYQASVSRRRDVDLEVDHNNNKALVTAVGSKGVPVTRSNVSGSNRVLSQSPPKVSKKTDSSRASRSKRSTDPFKVPSPVSSGLDFEPSSPKSEGHSEGQTAKIDQPKVKTSQSTRKSKTKARERRRRVRPKASINATKSVASRRNDDGEDDDIEYPDVDADDGGDDSSREQSDNGDNRASDGDEDQEQDKGSSGDQTKYRYSIHNNHGLQDLLVQKQLLDALAQSQLPAPIETPNQNQEAQANNINATHQKPLALGDFPLTKVSGKDQQAAGSLYSIDHGLLLYPSSDEEHFHKSKKKKKHEKSKSKKKMTIAMKKGGHKKKKQKKEEKKYLKEKKFKGAKKGKKSSKGKGGQGGKKGKKFYKDKGFKKKGFKNVYHKEEFGQKKSYFDEFRDKDFKKKWKKFDDKYNYAKMKKWQAKDVKGAKKMKDHGDSFKKYEKGKWKKKYSKHQEEAKKKKMSDEYDR